MGDSNLKDANNGLADMSKTTLQNLEKHLKDLKGKINENRALSEDVSKNCDDPLLLSGCS